MFTCYDEMQDRYDGLTKRERELAFNSGASMNDDIYYTLEERCRAEDLEFRKEEVNEDCKRLRKERKLNKWKPLTVRVRAKNINNNVANSLLRKTSFQKMGG